MLSSRHLFVASALFVSLGAAAQTALYAIYGTKATGFAGTVTSINVGVLPSGKREECERHIAVFEAAFRRSKLPSSVELIPSQCASVVPASLLPMVIGLRLPDAYVVKQSGNWAPVFTAWYGLSTIDPTMCSRLVEAMRSKLNPKEVEVGCLPPSSTESK